MLARSADFDLAILDINLNGVRIDLVAEAILAPDTIHLCHWLQLAINRNAVSSNSSPSEAIWS
jgi:hypothetical protein